ncbi:MAG: SDR family NAD(P)-dependent oxidoreductase [Hyphomicrobiales bacterium]|nr:SDR family NAD(P)-dependent oxidoreductase [Hyphomicrobiales bacterium]
MSISFEGRVAIVTGAGNGLGRAHALALAERGAKVVVNDFGGARDGTGGSSDAADKVVAEIRAKGGEAMAAACSVTDEKGVAEMVKAAMEKWSRIDILINNAGILRDKTFSKMEIADFRTVLDVHLVGSTICTKAVWDIMRAQNYGRIVLTASSSGIYGNFGQANYGAAKMAMVGLMNVLCQEGAKNDIRVNTLAPTAATRMTEELLPKQALDLMRPELITPGVLYLVSQDGPTRCILGAGAGAFARTMIYETDGVYIDQPTPEKVAAEFAAISDTSKQEALQNAFQQTNKYLTKAAAAKGINLAKG